MTVLLEVEEEFGHTHRLYPSAKEREQKYDHDKQMGETEISVNCGLKGD
jgi:hypothetical protein